MSKHHHTATSNFVLEGRFLCFATEDSYKLKYLKLATAEGEVTVKIARELRSHLWRSLVPGEWVQVIGLQKLDEQGDIKKRKAYEVITTNPREEGPAAVTPPLPSPSPSQPSKASILVCQKSDCCKRGGTAVTQALQTALSDRHLSNQVVIKGTGCMKRCKEGPNIVMPDKTRYCGIRPQEIPALIDKHFQSP